MCPTDLPLFGRFASGHGLATKPEGCVIREERGGEGELFIIPPSSEVISGSQLAFAIVWATVWTSAIALYVAIPNAHGAVFNFFALLAGLAGEYLALFVLYSAIAARLAVERILIGPGGIEQQTRLGPLRRTRRIALPLVREFRVDAFPAPRRGPRGFAARLYLLHGEPPAPGALGSRHGFRPLPMAEGARDADKAWLASRLNEQLRTYRRRKEPLTT